MSDTRERQEYNALNAGEGPPTVFDDDAPKAPDAKEYTLFQRLWPPVVAFVAFMGVWYWYSSTV